MRKIDALCRLLVLCSGIALCVPLWGATVHQIVPDGHEVDRVKVSADGKWVVGSFRVTADGSSGVFIWSKLTGFTKPEVLANLENPEVLAISTEWNGLLVGETLAVDWQLSYRRYAYMLESGDLQELWPGEGIRECFVSPDGSAISRLAGERFLMTTITSKEGELLVETSEFDPDIDYIKTRTRIFSPNGRYFFVTGIVQTGEDEYSRVTLSRYDLQTGETHRQEVPPNLDSEYTAVVMASDEGELAGFGYVEYSVAYGHFRWNPASDGLIEIEEDELPIAVFPEKEFEIRAGGRFADQDYDMDRTLFRYLKDPGTQAFFQEPANPPTEPYDFVNFNPETISSDGAWVSGRVQYVAGSPYDHREGVHSKAVLWDRQGRVHLWTDVLPDGINDELSVTVSDDWDTVVLKSASYTSHEIYVVPDWHDTLDRLCPPWSEWDYPYQSNGWRYISHGLEWVYEAQWPWIYHHGIGDWCWVAPGATLDGMWMYRNKSADWVWANSYWARWVYLDATASWEYM